MSASTIGAGAEPALQHRVVHGSILCDPIQPNPSADWSNPTQPTTSGEIWTQPNTTNNGAYSLVATYFIPYTEIISYF